MSKLPVTWVLVADGGKAKIYQQTRTKRSVPLRGNARQPNLVESVSAELELVPGMQWQAESSGNYETGRNATGMVFESVGTTRHMNEPHVDVRKQVKHDFARHIAGEIDAAKEAKKFDQLFLVVAPRVLGELRESLSKASQKAIVGEIPKDLTGATPADVLKHVQDATGTSS